MLNKDDIRRYSRQLLLEEIDEHGQQNLFNAHAVVIGLGGLGSLVARFLVGAGVGAGAGSLTLVDGDVVDISNLHRQASFNETYLGDLKTRALHCELNKVNPAVNLAIKSQFADETNLPDIVSAATCVIDCTDSISTRMEINRACVKAQIPLFITAASGLSWQSVNLPCGNSETSCGCYHCLVSQIKVDENCSSHGILGPVVGMAACHQATQALLFLAKRHLTKIQWGEYIVGNAINGTTNSFHLPPLPNCEVCQ